MNQQERHELAKELKEVENTLAAAKARKEVLTEHLVSGLRRLKDKKETYEDGLRVTYVCKSNTAVNNKLLAKRLGTTEEELKAITSECRVVVSESEYILIK